jgi:hypothetical protein
MSLSAILGHRVMFSECWTRDLLHEPPAGALAAASPRTRFNNSRGGAFVDSRSARNGVPARGPAAQSTMRAARSGARLPRLIHCKRSMRSPCNDTGVQDWSNWAQICDAAPFEIWTLSVEKDFSMDVVVRTYTGKGSKELLSLLEQRKEDVEKLMRSVKGFESYTLARSSNGEGGMSMTVCQDKAGTEESVRVAKEWIAKNATNIGVDAPKVSAGTVIIHATH